MSLLRWDRWELPIGLAVLFALVAAVGAGGSLSGPVVRDTAYLEGDADPARLPRRIVSTALVTDEILLGLVSPDRVACVTTFADNPKVSNVVEAAKQVAGRNAGDMERILVHEPDLVLLARFSRGELVDLLRQSGAPMRRMLAYDSLADIRANVIWVGRAVGEVPRAMDLVQGMDDTFARVRARVAGRRKPRVLYYGTGGYTPGAGTVFDELLAIAGGANVATEAGVVGHGHLPIERALALDPEVLVTAYDGSDEDVRTGIPQPEWIDDPVWANTQAVKNRRVHLLPGKHLVCISHHIAKAAEDLAEILHPTTSGSSASAECGVRSAESEMRSPEFALGNADEPPPVLVPKLCLGTQGREAPLRTESRGIAFGRARLLPSLLTERRRSTGIEGRRNPARGSAGASPSRQALRRVKGFRPAPHSAYRIPHLLSRGAVE